MEENRNDHRLMEKTILFYWVMHRWQFYRSRNGRPLEDTSRGQGRIIAILKIQPSMSTKDLAFILGIRKQSLNETLNKLEKAGYIERFASEKDKRVVMVRLTEKGEKIDQFEENPDRIDAFSCLNEEEQAQFAEMLDRIIENLSRQLDIDQQQMEARMKGACWMTNHDWHRHLHERPGRDFW